MSTRSDNGRARAFVIMPLAAEFDDIYEYLIRGAITDAGYDVLRADDVRSQQNILADIVQAISDSDLIIADLTTSNPNVYYELGLAHAFDKKVILLAQDIEEVPFDLRSYRIVTYATRFSRINEAKEELQKLATGAKDGSVQFGSPVSDFTRLSKPLPKPMFDIRETLEDSTSSRDDRGFLDFQSDVEESFGVMTNVIGEVGARFDKLNPKISLVSSQLQDNTVSSKKRRASVQELAIEIDDYAKWLHRGNSEYRTALARIGEGLNTLFSGEFKVQIEARPQLRSLLVVMEEIERNSEESHRSFDNLVSTLDSLPRLEKEFNRAKRQMAEELRDLTNNIEQTKAVLSRARIAALKLLGE